VCTTVAQGHLESGWVMPTLSTGAGTYYPVRTIQVSPIVPWKQRTCPTSGHITTQRAGAQRV
jgi:hypothetical protein